MGSYATLKELDLAFGAGTASSWLVTALANLNKFSGSKNMDDSQTRDLAILLAQEYGDLKYSMMQLFFYRFKCGDFGKFYGKIDPLVITCALKDFAAICEWKRIQYREEEFLARQREESVLREALSAKWYEFRQQLARESLPDTHRQTYASLHLELIDVDKKRFLFDVTKPVYELMESQYFQPFCSMWQSVFPGFSVAYRIVEHESAKVHDRKTTVVYM